MTCPPPSLQSQDALAGRLRSFSMQDLRSIPDTHDGPNYQDPLYLEDQMPRHRPPIGEWAERLRDVPRRLASPRAQPRPAGCECPMPPPSPHRVPSRGPAGHRHGG